MGQPCHITYTSIENIVLKFAIVRCVFALMSPMGKSGQCPWASESSNRRGRLFLLPLSTAISSLFSSSEASESSSSLQMASKLGLKRDIAHEKFNEVFCVKKWF